MPFIKKDDLKLLLRDCFMTGCVTGYGFDHEEGLAWQQEAAFKEYYKKKFGEHMAQWENNHDQNSLLCETR